MPLSGHVKALKIGIVHSDFRFISHVVLGIAMFGFTKQANPMMSDLDKV